MTMLDMITPVILTWNEQPNIARTLARLDWARDIVVVDSGSDDGTLETLRANPRVRLFNRAFDSHARQWSFAVMETGIETDWILRLDADYQVTDELIAELRESTPSADTVAYRIAFDYAIFGVPLRGSLYPANTILLRRGRFSVYDKGHTEAWVVEGTIEDMYGKVVHDDWKSTLHFVPSQVRYMTREILALEASSGSFKTWLRLHPPLMPLVIFFYSYFARGLFLNGSAGLYYSFQRLVAESILSLLLLERRIRSVSSSIAEAGRGQNGN